VAVVVKTNKCFDFGRNHAPKTWRQSLEPTLIFFLTVEYTFSTDLSRHILAITTSNFFLVDESRNGFATLLRMKLLEGIDVRIIGAMIEQRRDYNQEPHVIILIEVTCQLYLACYYQSSTLAKS
jgi:hypothetical protein